jgi:uncharacterized protein YjbI with pentapeptide repeats
MQAQPVNKDLFIEPGVNLQQSDADYLTVVKLDKTILKERWQSQTGRSVLERWRANNFDRQILNSLVGQYNDHLDLRGIPLTGKDLTGRDLSNIDFFQANLQGSDLKYADLSGSYLSESNIKATCFDFALMKDVLIDNTDFDSRTSFTGVNLSEVNFTLAALLQESALGQQRIANLEKKHPILAGFLKTTCDYGRSFKRFFFWCFVVILFFAIAFAIIPNSLARTSPGEAINFWESLYFSALAFASVNSDLQPVGMIGKVLNVLETGIGYVMTSLLVAILAKRTLGD